MPELMRKMLFFAIAPLAFMLLQPALQASGPVTRQSALEEMLDQTMMALYAFEFEKADSISREMQTMAPGHYLGHFTRANYLWWLIVTNPPDEDLEHAYASAVRQAQESIPSGTGFGLKPDELFYSINIYAIQARLSLKNKEYITTLRQLRAGVVHVAASGGQETAHHGLYLTSGLYQYMFGYVQQRYPLLKLVTRSYPDGNVEQGLQYLLLAAASDNPVWQTEAHYLLMKIFLEMELMPQAASEHSNWLTQKYPGNLVFLKYRYRVFKALNDADAMHNTKAQIRKQAIAQPGLTAAQRRFFLGE